MTVLKYFILAVIFTTTAVSRTFLEGDLVDSISIVEDVNNDERYTTIIDVLADHIDKFSKILNIIRKTDNINYLNELNDDAFTVILPVDDYLDDSVDIDLKTFDIEKFILFGEKLDFHENISAGINTLVIRWGDYPLIFETLNEKVVFYQQRNILNSGSQRNKDKYETYSEILNLDKPLLEEPSEQNCQIYESTSMLPFSKVTLTSFFDIYKDKYYKLNFLSQLVKFYERDYQFMKSFINNTFLVVTDNGLTKNFKNSIELNYIFKTNPELVTFDSNLDNKAKIQLITDQKLVLNELLIKGLLGNGVKKPGPIETLAGETPFELSYGIDDNGYSIFINEFKAESLPNIIQYKDIETIDYKNGERFGLSYIFNDYELTNTNLEFNLQKYLMGLNAYGFLQEMYYRDLGYLLNDEKEKTLFICVPNHDNVLDDTFDIFEDEYGYNKKNLIYHFIERKINIEEEFADIGKWKYYDSDDDEMYQTILFDSMFCKFNKLMGKHCQKLKLYKKKKDRFYINDPTSFEITNPLNPIVINNCLIYLISEPLQLPGSIMQSIGHEFIHTSQSLIFLQNLNLLNLPVNGEGYTIFVPEDIAWNSLDLNLDYMKKNINILNKMWKNFIWEGLLYTNDLQKTNYTNFNGDTIKIIDVVPNNNASSESVHIISKHQNFTLQKGNDILFEQGVIHPVSQIEYPSDIQITLKNLLETTNNGLDFLIFLKEIPELMKIVEENLAYSFIVPTSTAMLKDDQFNVNATDFESLMKLHVINSNATELMKNCDDGDEPVSTLLGGVPVYCKKIDAGGKILSQFLIMKNKQGDEKKVRILQKGCQTNNPNSCIYIVDDPMSLKWLNNNPILELHMNLSWQSFLMGLLVGGFFFLGTQVVGVGIKKYQKELARIDYDEFDDNDPNDGSQGDRRLLSARSNHTQHSLLYNENNQIVNSDYGSVSRPATSNTENENNRTNFEAGYSENSQSQPISVQQKKSQLFGTSY